ncbi:VacJ family lipoprotein [Thiohalobacter sp. IOR34]|uniref:MlaA family lipoprotein n=1 Tax=Thiohalobacter sp. IOR34 TaxID=3057176 RepID=UPI0025B20093|nr:VacJ family lipoprotein [Thiohalobacter sp. IOR34]WJW76736.1 VacJ family lipoprotein [Thiohalobacter sp. IOR34]
MTDESMASRRRQMRPLFCALLLALASGCALTPPEEEVSDPLEPINRVIDSFNDKVDRALIKPAARGYRKVVPGPLRNRVGNFFSNLEEPLTVTNDILQGKFRQGAEDGMRFVFNSSFGLLGLFDVATSFGLPKHQEDFGQTFARWGFGEGWYLVLPFLGPSNVRDGIGLFGDYALDPVARHDEMRERNGLAALRLVDDRSRLLAASKIRDTGALDRYLFTREAYRQLRWNRIHDGNPPPPEFDDEE